MDQSRLMKLAEFILNLQQQQKAIQGGEEQDSAGVANTIEAETRNVERQTRPNSQIQPQPQQQPNIPAENPI
jgi:hypothetical protein